MRHENSKRRKFRQTRPLSRRILLTESLESRNLLAGDFALAEALAIGDFDGDGTLGNGDVSLLTDAVRAHSQELRFDLNGDGDVSIEDHTALTRGLLRAYPGDSNLDGEFSTSDLIVTFQGGKYEDDVPLNATWAEGDWNADGDFSSSDLIVAFQAGKFEGGPRQLQPASADIQVELLSGADVQSHGEIASVSISGTAEPFVTIEISGTGMKSLTDSDGRFQFDNVPFRESEEPVGLSITDFHGQQISQILNEDGLEPLVVDELLANRPDPSEIDEPFPSCDPVVGDFDLDCVVDDGDVDLWRNTFGATDLLYADANVDGIVGFEDFDTWKANIGRTDAPQSEEEFHVYEPNHDEDFGLVGVADKFWNAGATIEVVFLDGSNWQHQQVETIAQQWEEFANIDFVFNDSETPEIAVTFAGSGNWSKIGTDSVAFARKDEASMRLSSVSQGTHAATVRRKILHEFGHALGFKHEHQNPDASFEWDREAVYKNTSEWGWSREQTDHNIFDALDEPSLIHSVHDPDSIMHYTIPKAWTKDGTSAPYNTQLSALDKEMAATIYPEGFSVSQWADFHTNDGWTSQLVGDFNNDDNDDIANFHPNNGKWWVSISNGSNSFRTTEWANLSTNSGWTSQLVGDFNNDGNDDIANFHPRNGKWWVSISNGSNGFRTTEWANLSTDSGWTSQVVGDFNNDGNDDIANFHPNNGKWWVSISNGSNGFRTTEWANLSTDSGWTSQVVGDFNNDGNDDIANFHPNNGKWWVSISNGSNGFRTTEWANFSTNSGWTSQLVGDFNNDGSDDIANFHPNNGKWWVSISNGSNGFRTTEWANFSTNSGWTSQLVGDFNNDGSDDIANFHPGNGTWWVSISTDIGFVTSKWAKSYSPSDGWTHVAGDFNGDGVSDVASFTAVNGTWWVGLG